jgi:uncharacterized protein
MPLQFNIRHLEHRSLQLRGELTVAELELDPCDELIHARQPLRYDLEVSRLEGGILVQGRLSQVLDCECARCLKTYAHELTLDDWTCHLALEGEECVNIVSDCVDLTPYIREDIFLAFPQHPLCGPDCRGVSSLLKGEKPGGVGEPDAASSVWSELNKLKLEN